MHKCRAVTPAHRFAEYGFGGMRHAVERVRGKNQKVVQHLIRRQLHVAQLGAFGHEKTQHGHHAHGAQHDIAVDRHHAL